MADNETNTEENARPWPGRLRKEIEQPAFVAEDAHSEPSDYYAGSDFAESDPNFTGLWDTKVEVETRVFERPVELPPEIPDMPQEQWPQPAPPIPTYENPQLPPRAWPPDQFGAEAEFIPETYIPDSTDETVRRSGLAYSAGIVFFVSVAFLMLIGWFADLLLGSSPFGLVVGIVVGSMIGFIQFFRISKQIYEPSNKKSDIKPLLTGHDENGDSY